MTTVTSEQIARLRSRTGVGILSVKQALEEAQGDEEKAIEILRKKGEAQAVKKSDREQGEGGIFAAGNEGKAVLIFLKCETDFVARSDGFLKLGQELADTLLSQGQDALEKAKEEKIPAAVLEFGENISVGETSVVDAKVVGSYVHSNRKIGVLVGLEGGTREQANDAAMHAAAMNPEYVHPDSVTEEEVAKERAIWAEQLGKEGKPAEIVEKIMAGKEKKYREENALLTQPFVKDPGKTVGEMLGGVDVSGYVRVAL